MNKNWYIKKIKENAFLPERKTAGSAGFDVSACLDKPIVIAEGAIANIPTGIAAMYPDESAALFVFPRSGLALKYGITLANSVGVVDSDYRGEIFIPLINHGDAPFTVEHGMRIAQIVIMPVILPEIDAVQFLPDSQRGDSGFGSTGLK